MVSTAVSSPPANSLMSAYQALLEKGYVADAAQSHALVQLQHLATALQADTTTPPKGLYFYGPVGRGKSMLMGLFYAHVQVPKRRVHFHAFMQELHDRLHHTQSRPGEDLMQMVATQIAGEATLLCFDEFYITNIADAMLLGRLFQALLKQGVVIVATSNWPMAGLFQGGVNRERFLPFIRLLEAHLTPVDIGSGRDYRVAEGGLPAYFLLSTEGGEEVKLEKLFNQFAQGEKAPLPPELPAKRQHGRAVWFTFETLCDRNLGREHYLELARAADTVVVQAVPVFTAGESNAALRFVALVDILYEAGRRLVVSAAAAPEELCRAGDAAEAFKRTASRLRQMTRDAEPAPAPVRRKVRAVASPRVRKSKAASGRGPRKRKGV